MAENALAKKMKLKAGQRAAIVGAPDGYRGLLQPLPDGVDVSETLDGTFDWIQLFVRTRSELESVAPRAIAALKPESLLWISFPKGSSKIQTDLTRDTGWDVLQTGDLKWVTLVSVDPTWSAFALRPYRPGETRQTW
ncbi:MAG TPA: hypothetical protein VFE33_27405 [Thermoanaerobaculia bacterium]|nr:hypothetical protein [Thermoanaerobaculia bacterium]